VPIAILDPFSGIAGDMTLGALIQCGLDPEWLRALPARLELSEVGVRIETVMRAGIACAKVDFDIPPQPHGRHIHHIKAIVERSDAPDRVKRLANEAFEAIGTVEAAMHGTTIERVHLHEVGAVDAILDVVGSIWGLEQLGVRDVYCGAISLGDGTVTAAHGVLPVPAPATLKLLEGHAVRPGPAGSGELVTPTGAALVKVLSRGRPPAEYVPQRSGFGAGTKEFAGRANALRLIIAEPVGEIDGDSIDEALVMLACDVDDMSPEHVAGAADALREAGARDVVCLATQMKKGRLATRIEVLAGPADADRLERSLFEMTTTIGVRRTNVSRRALPRRVHTVRVLGHDVRVKLSALPAGGERAKPEFDDVSAVARATGRSVSDVTRLATAGASASEPVAPLPERG
jgi:uncharacterized protein (TIGR00299 family) protein